MRVPFLRSSSVARFSSKTPKRRSFCVALKQRHLAKLGRII